MTLNKTQKRVLDYLNALYENDRGITGITKMIKLYKLPPTYNSIINKEKLMVLIKGTGYKWNTIRPNIHMVNELIKKHENRPIKSDPIPAKLVNSDFTTSDIITEGPITITEFSGLEGRVDAISNITHKQTDHINKWANFCQEWKEEQLKSNTRISRLEDLEGIALDKARAALEKVDALTKKVESLEKEIKDLKKPWYKRKRL